VRGKEKEKGGDEWRNRSSPSRLENDVDALGHFI